ncbi:MAG: peptidyl-prolyl cis-trans isomerase [Acidobacteriota bacterium]|nr:peptidyl-prolyl cis-trans isomerase [Acidobacteriota bacterium]
MKFDRRTLLTFATVVPMLVAVAACGLRDLPAPDVVARIDSLELPNAEFEAYLRSNSVALEAGLSSKVLSGLFDQYIDEVLLARLAVDGGYLVAEETEEQAVDRMITAAMPENVSGTDIDEYYAQHESDYAEEEQVLLRQILVEDRELAEAALEAVKSGMSFDEAARKYSQGPGAELGGLQGVLGRGDLPPAFAEVIFSLGVGEVSEIVAADYGFHLFQVIERRSAAAADVSEVRQSIAARLRQRMRARIIARLVEDARRSYNVEVYARNLPFNYEGLYE